MAKLRRILALVLVMVMTFSMLPVLASAEDAVSEIAAVETVEAPAAEVTTAVEDVAEIPAEIPAEAPVVEAIETAATETVAALQDVSADSVAKLVKYGANNEVTEEVGYATLKGAYEAAGKVEGVCNVVLLKDVVYLTTATSYSSAVISGAASKKSTYLSWNTENTTDPEVTVKGFWLDLNGYTVSVRCVNTSDNNTCLYQPAIYAVESIPVNIKNGTIIYRYGRTTQAAGMGLISFGFASSTSNRSAVGTADELYTPTLTVKDAELIRVADTGDFSNKAGKANAGPAIVVKNLASDIKIIRSDVIADDTGYGAISYYKNIYATTAPADTTAVEHKLYVQDSRIGVPGGAKAIGATTTVGGVEAQTTVSITTKGAAQFIGTDAVVISEGGPAVNFAAAESLTAAETLVTLPDVASLRAFEATTEGAKPTYLAPDSYASHIYLDNEHEHVLEKKEAVPATPTSDGLAEHYTCKFCNAYLEADGKTVTTLDKLVTKLDALTDEQMAALGVVAVAIDPDGTQHYYSGNSALKDAYTYAAQTWETSGGVVRMVTDFTYMSNGTRSADSVIDANARLKTNNKSYTYKNADNPELNGFWFDLGGHTLVFRSKAPIFGPRYSLPVNVRNGNIIFDNQATNSTSMYGCIKNGTSSVGMSDANEVYCPVYTFDNVTFIRTDSTYTAAPIFYTAAFQSVINLIDSTFINADGSNVFTYDKTSAEMKCTAEGVSKAYKHVVNLKGDTVVGTSSTSSVLFAKSAGNGIENDPDSIVVNYDETVTFLGTTLATISDAALASTSTTPSGYVVSDETYKIQLPDMTTAAGETTVGAGVDFAIDGEGEPVLTAFPLLKKQSDTTLCATFTPNGGEASGEMTLSAAFLAWKGNNYSGKITLTQDLPEEESAKTVAVLNRSGIYVRTYNSGSAANVTTGTLYAVTSDANNGDLTLDLGGKNLSLKVPVLVLDSALENFDLTIKNGTVSSSGTAPTLVLKGSGVSFRLEDATVENTNETASFPYAIHDSRYANSYAIVTDSTLTSVHGAAIAMMTTTANQDDASLTYYVKDSTLNSFVYGNYSPAAIASLTGLADSVYRPASSVILDNTVVNCEKVTNYSANSLLTLTALEAEATPAATVAYGELLNIACADAAEAVKAAELLGRNATAASKVTLQSDCEVAACKPVGVAGVETAFTLDLNGKALTGESLMEANGGAGTKVTVNVVGELGGGATKVKIFAHADAVDYTEGMSYVIEKDRYFTKYSLNLEESVSINLYTDGANGNADSVCYVQDGVDHTAVAGDLNEWVISTLAAKDMAKTVDAYAVKKEGNVTYLDFAKGISVNGYVNSDPGAAEADEAVKAALNATLESMSVYGRYAKKYFGNDYTAIEDAPVVDTSNLATTERKVSAGIPARSEENKLTGCFWGTSAVLEDKIGIKLYFSGTMFDGATAKVKYGDGAFADATLDAQDGSVFKSVTVDVAAKDFDTEITVALYDAEGAEIGTVTDSVEAYTARVLEGENAYNLAQALRAYGADAKRYAAAKGN